MNTTPTPPATPNCGLKTNRTRREESETPQLVNRPGTLTLTDTDHTGT